MATIRHRVGIAAPPERIYQVLTTNEGLSQWWTRDVDGDPSLGGTLRFFFGKPQPGAVMTVVDLAPNRHVGWHCVQGAAEWVGTHLTFDLEPAEGETVVRFTHADWREPVEFMYHCSTKWGYFLLGLKAELEGGEATPHSPYPRDMKISSWG